MTAHLNNNRVSTLCLGASANDGSRTLMTRDDGMFQFSEGALVSVIIGSSAADITKPEIEELARGTGVLIRTAMRVPHRYELTFDPAL